MSAGTRTDDQPARMRWTRSAAVARGTERIGAWVVPVIVVLVLAAFATLGALQRQFEGMPGGTEPFPLFTGMIAADPGRAALVFLLAVAIYSGLLLGLRWVAVRAASAREVSARGWWRASVDWVFARWWRLALVLLVFWLPVLALRWPGAVNPDFALMVTEIAARRSALEAAGATAPYDVYPIAHYLIPAGDLVWSNQHNAFLTLVYGGGAGVSGRLFHSYLPAIVFFSTTQALLTVGALARALHLVGRLVPGRWVRVIGLALVVANPLIPLWSMDLSKNPLFAAAFVWWLALVVEFAYARRIPRRRWSWEIAATTVVILLSVKFGVFIVLAGAIMMLLIRRDWKAVVVATLVPTVVFWGSLQLLFVTGLVIRDDGVESRVMQLQQLALTLREHPDALSAEDRTALGRIFDIDVMTRVYNPENADPVKSSGFDDNGSYRWKTVTADDWSAFTGIWARAGAKYPQTYLDAAALKSFRYLDPLSAGAWTPPLGALDWTVSYSLDLTPLNDGSRQTLVSLTSAAEDTPVVRYWISASAWAVVTVLLAAVAISLRRRRVYLWTLPLAIQVGVAVLSPLNGSGRYLLGLVYAAGIAFMILGIPASARVRPTPEPERIPEKIEQ